MLHKNLPPSDRHSPFTWIVADEAARLAVVPSAQDFAKICWQLSDDTFWVLKTHSPIQWVQFGGGTVIAITDVDGGTPFLAGGNFDGGTPSTAGDSFDAGAP